MSCSRQIYRFKRNIGAGPATLAFLSFQKSWPHSLPLLLLLTLASHVTTSLSRWWMNQQTSSTIDQREVLDTTQAVSGDPSPELAAAAKVRADATRPQARAAGGVWQPQEGSTYSLVVKKSKALVEGRRFELRPGSNVVVGRSQHANIVVKDEMVSLTKKQGR